MARGWRRYPGRPFGAANQLVAGFQQGFDAMSQWQRDAEEARDRQARREAAQAVAQGFETGPEATTTAIPGGTVENRAGTDHPGRVTTHQTPAREITAKNWAQFRAEQMKRLIAVGDYQGAAFIDQQINQMQHRGALAHAGAAHARLQQGDVEGAARALNQANQFMPTGTGMVHQVINGQLVAMGVDEETGQTTGRPVVVTPEYVENLLSNFQSIDNFLAHTRDRQMMELRRDEFGLKKQDFESIKKARESQAQHREAQQAHWSESNEIKREDIAMRRDIANAKSAKAKQDALDKRAETAYKQGMTIYEKLSMEELEALQAGGVTSAEMFASLLSEGAGDSSLANLSIAQIVGTIMAEFTGTPPPTVAEQAIAAGEAEQRAGGTGAIPTVPGAPAPAPAPAAAVPPSAPAAPPPPEYGRGAAQRAVPSLIPNPQRPGPVYHERREPRALPTPAPMMPIR